MRFPSGEKLAAYTARAWPVSAKRESPSIAFQSLAALSVPAAKIHRPSGEKRAERARDALGRVRISVLVSASQTFTTVNLLDNAGAVRGKTGRVGLAMFRRDRK